MKTFAIALTVLSFIAASFAGELGQPAAPLKIAEWVKGKPVDLAAAKDKNVVVVEFWATWCPPCVKSIPHLTELQKKFKDVQFVGVTDEKPDVVKKFVAKMGDKMDYAVAIDDARKTSEGYMQEFGVGGIPHAFVVDKQSRIVWHGHPMDGLDKVLEEVLAGKYDVEKSRRREAAAQKVQAFYEAAGKGTSQAKLDEMAKELEVLDEQLGGIDLGTKFDAKEILKVVKFDGLRRDYVIALNSGKGGTNLARIEKLMEDNAPKGVDVTAFKDMMKLQVAFSKYMNAATGQRGADKLEDYAKELGEIKTTNVRALNEMAWMILTEEKIKTRDYPLALKFAKGAMEASGGKEVGILDTYARALFDSGDKAAGIAMQKKAIALADDDETKKALTETLNKYEGK